MNLSRAATIWIDYHKIHSKKNTVRSYRAIIERFIHEFGDGPVEQVTPEQILTYLNRLTEGNKPYTKRIRFSPTLIIFQFRPQ
jgi:site-specific recombinase XerD